MFREKLKLTTEVSDAFEITTGQTKIIAQIDSFEDKIAVMREKKYVPDRI